VSTRVLRMRKDSSRGGGCGKKSTLPWPAE